MPPFDGDGAGVIAGAVDGADAVPLPLALSPDWGAAGGVVGDDVAEPVVWPGAGVGAVAVVAGGVVVVCAVDSGCGTIDGLFKP